jgi:hypothetical protein
MRAPASAFRLLTEFILFLLGVLILFLGVSGRIGVPSRPAALVALGVFFLYWAARAWMSPEPGAARLHRIIRAGSLAVVGVLALAIPLLPLRHAGTLLEGVGAVLLARGLVSSVLLLRRP